MIKKILSPIIYAVFLLLVTFLVFTVIPVIFSEIEIHGVWVFLLTFFLDLFITILLFWLGNKLMMRLEKIQKPKIADHFRQSSIAYLAFVYILISAIIAPAPLELFMHLQFTISVFVLLSIFSLAIFVNGIFLYKCRKGNVS